VSTVEVEQAHSLSIEEAKNALSFFENYVAKYGTKILWSGHNAELKGPGVSGRIVLTESMAKVSIKLGMLAKAAGVKPDLLQESIRKRMAKALVPEASE
jgi:putative polyhydroxyalkanoate system protein